MSSLITTGFGGANSDATVGMSGIRSVITPTTATCFNMEHHPLRGIGFRRGKESLTSAIILSVDDWIVSVDFMACHQPVGAASWRGNAEVRRDLADKTQPNPSNRLVTLAPATVTPVTNSGSHGTDGGGVQMVQMVQTKQLLLLSSEILSFFVLFDFSTESEFRLDHLDHPLSNQAPFLALALSACASEERPTPVYQRSRRPSTRRRSPPAASSPSTTGGDGCHRCHRCHRQNGTSASFPKFHFMLISDFL